MFFVTHAQKFKGPAGRMSYLRPGQFDLKAIAQRLSGLGQSPVLVSYEFCGSSKGGQFLA
jgi:hypothetical protein